MKTARVSVCLAILFMGSITSPLFAQGPSGSSSPGSYDIFGPRNIQLRSDIGDGVGYSKGFQTFGAFQSIVVEPDELIFFLNPRGIVTYLGDVAANAGVGMRWLDEDNERIWGGSVWYDYDNTGKRKYDQMGISLESLGTYIDVRANGYMPTNDDRDVLGQSLNGQNNFFMNFIGIGRTTQYSTPLKGGDFEIGGLLPGIGDRGIRPYIGGYYYQGEGTGAAYGWRARLETLITQDFWAQVAVTNDRLFGTNVMGAFTWYYGTGESPKWFQRMPMQNRLYQQVERQYRIAVYEEVYNDFITATRTGGVSGSAGGAAGTPILVLHVDNSAPAGGDGTVEHPLNFLPTNPAQHYDIVFVNRGNGSSQRYDHGVTLSDWQRLLGQGVQHMFTSQQGTYLLPGYSPGSLPRLTNHTGDVVTLASHNEVSGFTIEDAGRHGITGSNIVDFNINNIRERAAADAGIALVNATGSGRIFDVNVVDNGSEGLRIDNIGGDLELRIDRFDGSRNLTGISLNGSGSANFNVIARDIDTNDNGRNGIEISLDTNSSLVGLFDRVRSKNNGRDIGDPDFGDGFRLNADASVASFIIQHSTFDGNNLNGVSIIGNNADLDIDLLDNDSTMSGNLLNGVTLFARDSNTNLTLRNNVIEDNGGFGVIANGTSGTLNLIANDNIFRNNHGAALAYIHNDHGTGTIELRRNIVTGTQTANPSQDATVYLGQAFDIHLGHSTNVTDGDPVITSGIIDGNTIGDDSSNAFANVGGGIFGIVDQRATMANVTISHNLIAFNGGDGIQFIRRDEATVDNIVIDTNSIHHNNGDGIELQARASPNDTNDYTISNNSIQRNAGDGVNLFVQADASLAVDILHNDISFNGANGIETNEQATTATDLRFITGTWSGNKISNNTLNGIQLNGSVLGLVIGSTFDPNEGNAINDNGRLGIDINGPGSVFIGFNEIGRNGAGGIDIDSTTFFNGVINNNFIHDNRALANIGDGDGIEMRPVNILPFTVSASQNTIRDNAGRGVDILNAFDSTVTLSQNLIVGNLLEGVLVVNTASLTQDQHASLAVPMNADGAVNRSPTLTFTFTDNRVEGNGFNSPSPTTGLVLRVGTSGGGYGFTDDGGFFGEGRSGVGATITGNIFHGNQGDDVYIDSFVSTVDPLTTAGTWDATNFAVTTYRGDPLARLDLVFQNNTYDSIQALNPFNNNNTINGVALPNAGAFYNNAEAVFKSRDTTQTPAGPFAAGGVRNRNATRLGGRFGLPPVGPTPLADAFLYPGIGQSTFRLMLAPTGNSDAFGPNNPFAGITDAFYVSPFASANGNGPNAPLTSMPYGWNELGPFGSPPRPQ